MHLRKTFLTSPSPLIFALTGTNEEYLFDLQADPHELVNRINDPGSAAVRDQLRDDMEAWMLEIGDRTFPY